MSTELLSESVRTSIQTGCHRRPNGFGVRRAAQVLVLAALAAILPQSTTAQTWELVWADEFDYNGAPDPSKWDYDIGAGGWGNQESQYYTDRPENVRVDGDNLIIEARAESFSGSDYTSARVVTRGLASWTYGRIEARAQLPSGVGTWPAIWMLAEDSPYGIWPASGEIDIVEHVGKDQGRVHSSLHFQNRNSPLGNNPTGSMEPGFVSTSFHLYAVEWGPREIRFYVDDQLVDLRTPGTNQIGVYQNPQQGWAEWPFDQPFHLLLNIAVGGTWGGPTIDTAAFPTQMLVDYVRVYENVGTLPQVTLGPVPTTVDAGGTVTLSAQATDPDGQIAKLELLQGEVPIALAASGSLESTFANAQSGCYAISARAEDATGWPRQTEAVEMEVGTGCGQAPATISPHPIPGVLEMEYYDLGGNGVAYSELDGSNQVGGFRSDEAVEIGIYDDGSGGLYMTGISRRDWVEYTVEMQEGIYRIDALARRTTASVSDPGRFELQIDGTAVASITVGPETDWTVSSEVDVALPGGMHVLRFQPRQAGFEIDRITFVETGASPIVSLDAPADGTTLAEGADVVISASASDTDQDLAGVIVRQGIGVLTTLSSAPYETTISGASAGCYSITVQAFDARGNTATSSAADVQVGQSCVRAPYLMRPAVIPGTIQAAYFDLGDAHLDLTSGDGTFRSEPVDLAFDATEGYYVTDVASREWIGYTVNVASAGTYRVDARVRATTVGALELEMDQQQVGDRLTVPATNSVWQTVTLGEVPLAAGVQELKLDIRSGGFEIASLRFVDPTDTSVSPELPERLILGTVYPNPARNQISLPVTIPGSAEVTLELTDLFGRRVSREIRRLPAGETTLTVPVGNLASGTYILTATVEGTRLVRPVTVLN